MPETLILHVKGTAADTTELPVDAVRSAIAQGEITESQLIWSAEENAWKQVRDWPQLRDELLTLHVKGTEKDTVAQPRKAVRAEIARGALSHSQLIWSPAEHAWKQVRELPDLLPSQKLAPAPARIPLAEVPSASVSPDSPHSPVARVVVKASQNPAGSTRALRPKARPQIVEAPRVIPQVRIATVSPTQPEATQATSTVDPEQVAAAAPEAAPLEHTDEAPPTLAIPLAGAPRTVPQVTVTPADIAEPAEAGSDAPPRVIARVRVADDTAADASARTSQPMPQVRAVASTPEGMPQPRVAVPVSSTPQVRVRPADSLEKAATDSPVPETVVEDASGNVSGIAKDKAAAPKTRRNDLVVASADGPHPFKWLCIGMGALILLLVGSNYLLISKPLSSAMHRSPYPSAHVFAHLGAFVQPNVVVIHIHANGVKPDDLPSFLVTLAHDTPISPLSHDSFDRVALTTGWLAHYTVSGGSWRELGDMANQSKEKQRKMFVELLGDAGGQKLFQPSETLDHDEMAAERDKVWDDASAYFTGK